jgi:hypothetical protein
MLDDDIVADATGAARRSHHSVEIGEAPRKTERDCKSCEGLTRPTTFQWNLLDVYVLGENQACTYHSVVVCLYISSAHLAAPCI